MARILAISSHVAHGSVGLSAMVPLLQTLGHEVLTLPTTLLSNHRGHDHVGGSNVDPEILANVLDAIEKNGWLATVDALITGYLPTVRHVDLAIDAARRADARMTVVDPVLGDDPDGLYIDVAVAEAVRDRLLPLATLITPNRFELTWLTGKPVTSVAEAVLASSSIRSIDVVVTSVPVDDATIANVTDDRMCAVSRREYVPHGTGDCFAALYLGHTLGGAYSSEALGRATAGVDVAIQASEGFDELQLASNLAEIVKVKRYPTIAI
jgi:pyridoxine kinase